MASFNQVTLMGNLCRSPELRYLPSNQPVVEWGMATNRKWKDQSGQEREEVCFVDCTAFGRTGEVVNQYCTRGDLLFVQGRLKYKTWEDKQGGGKRSKLSVVVDTVQLMPRREQGQHPADDEQPPASRPASKFPLPRRPQQDAPKTAPPYNGSAGDGKELDIPFGPNKC
jgi:single-strand DNA-binding protein